MNLMCKRPKGFAYSRRSMDPWFCLFQEGAIENVKTKDGAIIVLYKVKTKYNIAWIITRKLPTISQALCPALFFRNVLLMQQISLQNSFTGQITKKMVVTQVHLSSPNYET